MREQPESSKPVESDDLKLMRAKEAGDPLDLVVKSAALPRLLERLASEQQQDFSFQRIFLLCYRSILTPAELLDKLMLRYCITPGPALVAAGSNLEKLKHDRQGPVRVRVLAVLKFWLENHFYDFEANDRALLSTLTEFLDNVVTLSNARSVANFKVLIEKKLSQPPLHSLLPSQSIKKMGMLLGLAITDFSEADVRADNCIPRSDLTARSRWPSSWR